MIILDTPQSRKQLEEKREVCSIPSRPLSRAESGDAASLSVSAVIDALHLSDIDWDTVSFTSSPTSQAETTVKDETHGGNGEGAPSSDVRPADSRPAAELCYTDCPLRDRVLMRNTALNQTKKDSDVVSKHLIYELTLPASISQEKRGGEHSSKVKESVGHTKEVITNKSQTHGLKEQQILLLQTHNRIKEESNGSKKPPQKYKFVRTALSHSLQRCSSDPDQSDRKNRSVPPTTKKSVCSSLCSSSEDSDMENQPSGPRRLTKTNKIKRGFISDVPLKTVSNRFKSIEPSPEASHKLRGAVSQSGRGKTDGDASSESKWRGVQTSKECDDVFLQTPTSPVASFDRDDSVVCSNSPLPLAERLRLKFLQ